MNKQNLRGRQPCLIPTIRAILLDIAGGAKTEYWHRLEKPQGCPLTQREWEVMSGLALGRSTHHIAAVCGTNAQTVRAQALKATRRLGFATRAEAIERVKQKWPAKFKHKSSDPPINPTLQAYLRAFDRRTLRWRDEDNVRRSREEMGLLFAADAVRKNQKIVRDRRHHQNTNLKGELDRDILPGM